MFSNILLEKLVRPSRAGGGLNESYNQISQDALNRDILEAKARYAPLTAAAQAASQMAYANLMGPQFAAKLLGNENILANVTDPAKRQALANMFAQTGVLPNGGQGGGNYFQPAPSLLRDAAQGIKSIFSPSQQRQQSQSGNAFTQPPVRQPQGKQPQGLTPEQVANQQKGQPTYQGTGSDTGYSYDKEGRNVVATNEEQQNAGNQEPTFAENVGTFKGTVKQGEEAGKIRANTVDELDQQYQQAIQSEVPLQHMNEIVTNPVFRNMRNFPWFQGLQLKAKSKIGSPEEQRLIGDFQTTALNAVAQTIMGFRGRILDKEVGIATQMKINPEDTIGVTLGKLPSIETFNEMTKQRSRIAARLMEKEHLNRGEALEKADKKVDGNKIRKNVEKLLDYKVTITNKRTGEKKTISASEARKLGVPNV